jgi:hypothetical protein
MYDGEISRCFDIAKFTPSYDDLFGELLDPNQKVGS